MRILFVSESTWMAGVVYDLHMMAEGLSLLGHQVYAIDPGVAAEDGESNPADEIREVARAFPNARVYLKSPRLPSTYRRIGKIRGLRYLNPAVRYLHEHFRRYVEIRRLIQSERFDVIVLYSGVRSGFQTVLLAKKHRIPVVFRNVDILHNLWPTAAERFLAKAVEKRVYPRTDMILALTPKYAEYLIRMGADKRKVQLLVFPIDLTLFHPAVDCSDIRQRWGIDRADLPIVFVGTLYEFSGLGHFIQNFPVILQEVPRAKLVIVGDGPLRSALERIVAELDLHERVIITGYQPFADMPRYINIAGLCLNVFPITDTTKDIFSAKIIQYLACGKPVVSTSLPGITTLLPSQPSGVVYADDMDSMVKEVITLLRSPARREQLGETGLRYVQQAHSHEKIIHKLEDALRTLISA